MQYFDKHPPITPSRKRTPFQAFRNRTVGLLRGETVAFTAESLIFFFESLIFLCLSIKLTQVPNFTIS